MFSLLDESYDIEANSYFKKAEPPELDYFPAEVTEPVGIGIIGCCPDTILFLTAYLRAGFNIVAICDANVAQAKSFCNQLFPSAKPQSDYRRLLDNPAIEVVTVSLPDDEARNVVSDCIKAGKHVLVQKYFITSLDYGEELKKLADEHKVKIAVNMEARWAPAWRYATQLIRQGYLGEVTTIRFNALWNHNHIKGTPLDTEKYLLPHAFGFDWFDLIGIIMNNRYANSVFSYSCCSLTQIVKPPLLSETVMCYPNSRAGITLDGDASHFAVDRTAILGEYGAIISNGSDRSEQKLWFVSRDKYYCPVLTGDWLPGGYHGALAELLVAAQEGREPENGLTSVLNGLAHCLAAVASNEIGLPVKPGAPGARELRS